MAGQIVALPLEKQVETLAAGREPFSNRRAQMNSLYDNELIQQSFSFLPVRSVSHTMAIFIHTRPPKVEKCTSLPIGVRVEVHYAFDVSLGVCYLSMSSPANT